MTMLDSHLEQISLCSAAISELEFPQPKIFANALLHPHDITALIRDTEAHERALFSVAPTEKSNLKTSRSLDARKSNRFTGPGDDTESAMNGLYNGIKSNAISTLLGGDFMKQLQQETGGNGGGRGGEVDVDGLLRGAERLCEIYPVAGAPDKIASLRSRYEQLSSSIAYYDAQVSKQAKQLERINRPKSYGAAEDEEPGEEESQQAYVPQEVTAEDLQREEEEIRELEKKKRDLEERVSGMERDLGGLLR
ncbi:hypothetical protein MMC09_004241 [Bachmanniomyces sp. S44760]|nr:hypothetical protein [Bachmanniomyces sp. S44760]